MFDIVESYKEILEQLQNLNADVEIDAEMGRDQLAEAGQRPDEKRWSRRWRAQEASE